MTFRNDQKSTFYFMTILILCGGVNKNGLHRLTGNGIIGGLALSLCGGVDFEVSEAQVRPRDSISFLGTSVSEGRTLLVCLFRDRISL